ncbi:MAP kinase kinase PBS2 [Ceratocystis platani]|uniref:mitogen-activated protein kinase kinase n=1 Tax=Ceratocystis fimbriata f. sp. platani TaxID=88771 RepID=A0A0F8D323_CERFI|nr:MAP kinase kinase PBS2 [Ceratocystis platani]
MGAGSSPAPAIGTGASDAAPGAANKTMDSRAAFIGSQIDEFREFINPEKGWLNFNGSATLTKDGVHFANGNTYSMSLNEIESLGELGKGNYGTVYKVRHAKPKQPRLGPGLSGSKPFIHHPPTEPGSDGHKDSEDGLSGTIMAMKEIRMELDKAKFKTIAKELMILHQCASPYIIDFYGAFMQDGFVYMCIEYMDGGSIDKLYKDGVPEDVLQHITLATVLGLNELKETHNIIHRDVKPTNILVNTRGQVKICDFGVSGDLVASKAKTNIGCQSYMPPERIHSNPTLEAEDDGSYGVQSDIWSLGLSIIECALGKYPYDVNASILVQLNTIVKGEAPKLPEVGYSATAQDFVASCLAKNPTHRPTYTALLRHAWLASVTKPPVIQEEDEGGVENEQSSDSAQNKAAATETTIDTTVNAMGNMQLSTASNLGTRLKHVQQPNDELVANWVKRQLQKKVEVKERSEDHN